MECETRTLSNRPQRHQAVRFLAAAIVAALSGCATGEGEAQREPTLEQRLERLSGCTPADLETLLPWTGPAFDPSNGTLVAPLPSGHVEAVVQGWRDYSDAATTIRHRHGSLVAQDVFARPGFLGLAAVESVQCDISISHSLWRDEASMFAFVASDPHSAAMAAAHQMHHAVVGAHWSGEPRGTPPGWREGIARLIAEERRPPE